MNIPVANCSSCAACANVCTRGAISMKLDNEGFYRPIIDLKKCIQCGECERVCPWIKNIANPNESTKTPKTLAAYLTDEMIRLNSSSGGIFSVLAEKILDDGGVVVGVAQLNKTHFGHIVVNNKIDLEKLRGSKYVQADTGLIYKEVRSLLKANRKVLFSGTPCQVAALYSVLGKNYFESLTTVDIICHGSPSVKVFEKYISEIEATNAATVSSSRFRDKRKGWRLFSMTLSLNTVSGECFQLSNTLHENIFLRSFLKNTCLNTSCADCHYGKLPRIADITLGDYWNIASVHPKMDDDKGTSVVLLNTVHGEEIFNFVSSKLHFCESSLEKAIAGNPCIIHSSKPHPNRTNFFDELDNKSLDELFKKYCPTPSLMTRAFLKAKRKLRNIKKHFLNRG